MNVLEKIISDGFVLTEYKFGDCNIYARGNDRLVYNPKEGRVISRYDIGIEYAVKK